MKNEYTIYMGEFVKNVNEGVLSPKTAIISTNPSGNDNNCVVVNINLVHKNGVK